MTDLTVADLTQTTLEGTGVFDVLMRANRAHLENEYDKNRIKGAEYATVYLGSMESVMRASLEFLLQRQKISLEAQLLEQQIILAQVEVLKANAAVDLVRAQVTNTQAELAIIQANALKIPAEIALLTAQTSMSDQQRLNLIDELQTATLQRSKLVQETENLATQKLQIAEQTLLSTQQRTNLAAQASNIPKEGLVLDGQKCKLDAEFDVLKQELLKSTSETALLTQKNATERAQTMALGVDDDSMIGKQKALYQAQAAGFSRDAEQKAAQLMISTWNSRRMTNEDTEANDSNMLYDPAVGRAITKMLAGVGA